MPTIKFDTHITRQQLLDILEQAPQTLPFGNNYAGVTYRLTDAGVTARADLLARVKAMRNRELDLTRDEAALFHILLTVRKAYDGYVVRDINTRNLPAIVALYQVGIREMPEIKALPYYI